MLKQVALMTSLVVLMPTFALVDALPAQLSSESVPQDSSAVGYLDLHKRHPDASEGRDEFERQYSANAALGRLDQIRGFLDSFRQLTRRAGASMSDAEMRGIGNTGGDMQTIGFHNIPPVIEGAILKQDYQLRQSQYQLAQLQRACGDISSQELDRTRTAYADATRRLQVFLDTRLPTD